MSTPNPVSKWTRITNLHHKFVDTIQKYPDVTAVTIYAIILISIAARFV